MKTSDPVRAAERFEPITAYADDLGLINAAWRLSQASGGG